MAFQRVTRSEGSSSPGDSDLCYDLLPSEDVPECQEVLEIQEVHEPSEEWMLSSGGDGLLVDPNTQEPVEAARPPSVVGCQSYVSSTELISSAPSTAMESVEKYLCDSRSPSPKETSDERKMLARPQANTVKRVIILQPGEDPDRATAKAISDITDSLNQRAAERLAAGCSPEKETVIEITHIRASADACIAQENHPQPPKDSLASTYIKAASQRAPASVAILQSRKGGSSAPPPSATPQQPKQHQHHRRKSPHLKRQTYTPSSPPCVPKQQQSDLSEGCYFVSRAHLHSSPQPSPAAKLKSASSCEAKSSKARLAPGTAIYASPASASYSKGPTILRSTKAAFKNNLPHLKVNHKAAKSPSESMNLSCYSAYEILTFVSLCSICRKQFLLRSFGHRLVGQLQSSGIANS